MANPPYCVLHHDTWVVRLVIPADARQALGQSVFRVSTKSRDKRVAAERAHGIVAGLKRRIDEARTTLQRSEKTEAERLAVRFRELRGAEADRFALEEVVHFALREAGHAVTDYGRRLAAADGVIQLDEPTLARLQVITGETTPFLKHMSDWEPHSGLKPRPHDQAVSSLKTLDAQVRQTLEHLEAKHVQKWIDDTIQTLSAKTVKRKVGEIRNFWRYLQSRQLVSEDRDPFANRRIKDPASRRETRDEKRQKWTPAHIRQLIEATKDDQPLNATILIMAYSGARPEGTAKLKASDIRRDPDTNVHFMRMDDKTIAGDRDVPIHPRLKPIIDQLVKAADHDGYLIHSAAKNKYTERSQPISKRFGRLKTRLGFDSRYVLHSIRKTVAGLMQDAGVAEGVAADIVGHQKPTMTYGLYAGETRMDLRASELARAVHYPPTGTNGDLSPFSTT